MYIFIFASFLVTTTSVTCASYYFGQHLERSNSIAPPIEATSPFVKIIQQRVFTTETIYSTPAVVLVGKGSEIWQCLQTDPRQCEVFYSYGSNVLALHIAGEYLYAGVQSGVILKCKLNQKNSCKEFQSVKPGQGSSVESFTTGDGFLYAGLYNKTLLRCQLHETNSCQSFYELNSIVYSANQFKRYVFFGLSDGKLIRCTLRVTNSCTELYNMHDPLMGFSMVGNSIFASTRDGRFWNCTPKFDARSNYCVSNPLPHEPVRDLTYFNGIFYSLKSQGGIYTCQWAKDTTCTDYGNFTNTHSMVIAYGTYQMRKRYRNENTACTWQSKSKCPPFVTYYNEQQRHMLEVYVDNGRLYNSQELLVDTRDADEGRSGAVAIFAMGPDGRILLSKRHSTELLHTSSLFAGSPVSGAGEMIVKNGVIEKIMACSEHYLPDVNLNEQVVQSLRAQGYTDPIVSVMCDEFNSCGQSDVQ